MPFLLPCGCVASAVVVDADHVCTKPTRPIEADLSTTAALLIALRADPTMAPQYRACETMWAFLVGLDNDRPAAVALAERIVDLREPLTAYTPTL